jgi:protein-disulfide isomerase
MSEAAPDNERRFPVGVGTLVAAAVVLVAGIVLLVLAKRTVQAGTVGVPSAPGVVSAPAVGAAMQWATVLSTPWDGGVVPGDLSWLRTGVTEDGRPWMGAARPALEIDEFVDFQCPRCCEACPFLQRLFTRFPDKVRIYIRNLPRTAEGVVDKTDGASRSCQLARAAICAGRQGRYWEAHDYLFHHREQMSERQTCVTAMCQALGLDDVAFRTCLEDPSVNQALGRDVADAQKLGIRETPTFVAGGKAYRGGIPDDDVLAGLTAVEPR